MEKQWKQWETLIFLGSKITSDSDCSHEIKTYLLLGRKAMTNLDSVLESRDITLPAKVHRIKAMVFPVVMYGCERCTIKKAEQWRIDAFELWWNGLEWVNLIQMTIISTTVGGNPSEEMEWPSWSTEESKMQYLDAISKMTEWSLFVSKANHSLSQ